MFFLGKRMLAPLPSETFHSLIIRNAMVNIGSLRQRELKGVISYNGYWKMFPKPDKQTLAGYSKEVIISYIQNKCPAIGCFYKPNSFDLDLIYNNLFSNDFLLDEAINNNCHPFPYPVSYCVECFKGQIFQHGVCYFKSEWYLSDECSLHKTKLLRASDKNLICKHSNSKFVGNIYTQLQSIMTGVI